MAARILAGFIDEPEKVTEVQLEKWVKDFDSWDVCDQVVDLFSRTRFARRKIVEWSEREEEFVKRAAFIMIAKIAWRNKTTADKDFEEFFEIIQREAIDEHNYVRKAVNWALRNIGKRNQNLRKRAIAVAREIQKQPW